MRLFVTAVAAMVLMASPVAAQTPDAYTAILEREAPLYQQPPGPERDSAVRALIPGYEALAEAGDTRAMFRLANIAQLLKDEASLFRWLRKMADLGDAEGQYYLSSTLRRLPDCSEGRQWLIKSAEQGYEKAVSSLAFYYDNGICGPRDAELATVWYEKAARMGIGVAQNNLGFAYMKGDGIKKNLVEAYAWLNLAGRHAYAHDKAADWDPADSVYAARTVRNQLSDSDIPKAEARLRQLCGEDKICSRIAENRRP